MLLIWVSPTFFLEPISRLLFSIQAHILIRLRLYVFIFFVRLFSKAIGSLFAFVLLAFFAATAFFSCRSIR